MCTDLPFQAGSYLHQSSTPAVASSDSPPDDQIHRHATTITDKRQTKSAIEDTIAVTTEAANRKPGQESVGVDDDFAEQEE